MKKPIKRIYLDHAAAAPMDKRVKKAMEPFWMENFGNPNALYKEGLTARNAWKPPEKMWRKFWARGRKK